MRDGRADSAKHVALWRRHESVGDGGQLGIIASKLCSCASFANDLATMLALAEDLNDSTLVVVLFGKRSDSAKYPGSCKRSDSYNCAGSCNDPNLATVLAIVALVNLATVLALATVEEEGTKTSDFGFDTGEGWRERGR